MDEQWNITKLFECQMSECDGVNKNWYGCLFQNKRKLFINNTLFYWTKYLIFSIEYSLVKYIHI